MGAPPWSYQVLGYSQADGDRLARHGVWPLQAELWQRIGYAVEEIVAVYSLADRCGYNRRDRLDVAVWSETRLPSRTVLSLLPRVRPNSREVADAIWLDIGWQEDQLANWQRPPMLPPQGQWPGAVRSGATLALECARYGLDPATTADWFYIRASLPDVAALGAAGFTAADAREIQAGCSWTMQEIERIHEFAEEWLPTGLPASRVRIARAARLTADEASELTEEKWLGLQVLDALQRGS